jgi:hypothetical protein
MGVLFFHIGYIDSLARFDFGVCTIAKVSDLCTEQQ